MDNNDPNIPPRIPSAPVAILDALYGLGLSSGLRRWDSDRSGGVLLELFPGSELEQVVRHWDARTEALEIALGELGYCFEVCESGGRTELHLSRPEVE